MSDAQPSFALGNPPNNTTIHKSTHPADNKALACTVSANAAVTFAAGKPVAPGQAPTATRTLISMKKRAALFHGETGDVLDPECDLFGAFTVTLV